MKKLIRPALMFVISISLAAISAAFTNNASTQPAVFSRYSNAAFFYQTTVTPQVEPDRSEVGSTDGITLMSFIIVAIVIIPILLKRKNWTQL